MDSENDASWQWVFKQLVLVYGVDGSMYFVFDRHASIRKGVQKIFSNVGHGCCHIHLERNVSSKFKCKGLSNLVGRAAKVFRVGDFRSLFAEIEGINTKWADYLSGIRIVHWSRANCDGERFNLMCSNIAESLNAVLERTKGFPIISMIEYIRTVMMRWFTMRRAMTKKHNSKVTPNVDKLFVTMLEKQPSYGIDLVSCWDVSVQGTSGSKYNIVLIRQENLYVYRL